MTLRPMPRVDIAGPSAAHVTNDLLDIINNRLQDRKKALHCVVRTPLEFPVAALGNALQTVHLHGYRTNKILLVNPISEGG